MSKTAVIILNWNGRKLLEQFLPSVVKYTMSDSVEIIIADNNSDDDSVSFVSQTYPNIKLICLKDNYGYAEGYNRALRQIEADYFVLLNSDVEVTDNWLSTLVNYLDVQTEVVAIQPKILSKKNEMYFEYAGASGGFIDKYGYPFCRGRIFSELEQDRGQYDTIKDIFWASGACLMIRSFDFFDVGGLDASFFAHMEEIDLCWRLNARGKRIVCLPSSVVYHVGGATLAEESPRKTFLNFRNNLLMLYKNLPKEMLYSVLYKRICLDYLAAFKYLFIGKFLNAKAVYKAHKEFRRIKNSYLEKRQINLEKTTCYNIKTIYKKSVLVDYYFKRNKLFSELLNF